jgi:hypothetical protein
MGTSDAKNVNKNVITAHDMKTYKSILQLTNAHLQGYKPSGNIQISNGSKFKDVISKLFPQSRQRGIEKKIRQPWERY